MPVALYTVDPLAQEDAGVLRGVADLLLRTFPTVYHSDLPRALADVVRFAPEDVSFVARDPAGSPIGWLQASHAPAQPTGEIKLLAVDADARRLGIGRTLMLATEARLRAADCVTAIATVADTRGRTSLSGTDATLDVPRLLETFHCHPEHPAGFFLRLGYRLVGILPDAYGLGKHDLTLARRIAGK